MGEYLIGGGSAIVASLVTLFAAWLAFPKVRAEARKLNVEADGMVVEHLAAEVKRLDALTRNLRDELDALKKQSSEREGELEHENRLLKVENKQLKDRLRKVEGRLAGIEEIFNVASTPADMKAKLAELDSKTGGKS